MNAPTPIRAPETVNNHNAPVIGDQSPQATASVQDRAGLYVAIVAFGISLVNLALLLDERGDRAERQALANQLLDAKLAAAVAPVNEQTRTAVQNSRLALDRADKQGAALEAKGLIKLENH